MQRRNFVKNASLAGLSVFVLPLSSCFDTEKAPVKTAGFSLREKTIDQLQQMMKNGEQTSEAITQAYLEEIGRIDGGANGLHSVIELNPEALDIARETDKERRQGKIRGPLHGIPVLIKDNIDTADRMHTTAGSLALADNIAQKDAFIVQQLRKSGAVILGKTNLSEFANFRSTRSSSGWSSRGGQTHNPYVLDRSPCGSSSGSAVAVAANLCAVSIGTETDGSIACPASMNSVVGIKPTVSLLSRSGIIPISKTQDTAGPFGRTVRDAVLLLSALVGVDPADAITVDSTGLREKDLTKFLDKNGLQGKRIGIEKTFLKKHEGVDALLAKAIAQLKQGGAEIIEVEFMKANNESGDAESTVLHYEFKDGLNKYLAKAGSKMKSLADIIAFNKSHAKETMPFFMQETLEKSEEKGDLNTPEYKAALGKSLSMRETIEKIMGDNKLDALCGPATGAAWCIDPVNGDAWSGYGAYGPAAVAGYPSITVPMGFLHELPLGLSFFARRYEEPQLIAMAYAYEQISKNRKAPEMKKTVAV